MTFGSLSHSRPDSFSLPIPGRRKWNVETQENAQSKANKSNNGSEEEADIIDELLKLPDYSFAFEPSEEAFDTCDTSQREEHEMIWH
jgi:hypothetical protein